MTSSPPAPSRIEIHDVTLRDGMQVLNRSTGIPLADRLELFALLTRAGMRRIEVGSYVSPRFVPALADTPELLRQVRPRPEQDLAVLVPNLRHYRRLERELPVSTIALFVSASETYSRKNTQQSTAEAMASAREVADAARADGYHLRAFLSCAFRDLGEPAPEMPAERVCSLSAELVELGADVVALSDTEGRASPADVRRIVRALVDALGADHLAVHLHDRYGQGVTNAYVAWQEGITQLDASIGGVGGTSSMRDAVGNLATEELARLFHGLGVETGLDEAVLAEATLLVAAMARRVGEPRPPSKVLTELLARAEASD